VKLALCNEVLRHLPFEAQCQFAAALGCNGLEVSPFTLADDPSTLTGPMRSACAASPPTTAS
jgi:hypothetical protein